MRDQNPDRLDDGARAEAEMKEREAKRHPLEAYADSYAQMGRDPQGDGRVDCRSVEVDIRQNMIPVTTALPAPQGDDGLDIEALLGRLEKRAKEDDDCADNNRTVAVLLSPELAKFNGRDEAGWNTYAVRMAVDHRSSMERDRKYAADLLEAAALIRSRAAEIAELKADCAKYRDCAAEKSNQVVDLQKRMAGLVHESDVVSRMYMDMLKSAEAAESRLASAMEALEPFAKFEDQDGRDDDELISGYWADCINETITFGDLRRARTEAARWRCGDA